MKTRNKTRNILQKFPRSTKRKKRKLKNKKNRGGGGGGSRKKTRKKEILRTQKNRNFQTQKRTKNEQDRNKILKMYRNFLNEI